MSTDRPDRPHAHPHAYPHGAAPGRTTEHGAYYTPTGGMPGWNDLVTDRAVVTTSYAVIPRGCLRDIVTSLLPFWTGTRLWVLARPQTGFAETFSQYLVEVAAGGGSDRPETDPDAETVLFVVDGALELTLDGTSHPLPTGGYAYLPPAADWTLHNRGGETARFHWIRKNYQRVDGLDAPDPVITEESAITPGRMPEWGERWSTTRFVDPDDLRHDMHVNIVSFEPGGLIPFAETHVMEHGLYILEGRAVYRLNDDWVEVQEGDFLWLRAFCPQACYAAGPGRFRYLLYKDVNRHMPLGRPFG